jgi:outer membrane protein assembly factor BamB
LAPAADWTGFRGSRGDGAADDKNVPAKLAKDNILWKVKLPGAGSSSPITVGAKVIVTCYSGYGQDVTKPGKGFGAFGKGGPAGDQSKLRLLVVCLDRAKGDVLWTKEIMPKLPEFELTGFIREHGYASSTPVTDGKHIYVFFGKTGVLAFDLDGKQLWQADVGAGTDKWGTASSPIVHNDLVIVNAAIEGQKLSALDKATGKEVWNVDIADTNWTSPILVETADGKHELLMSLPGKVAGYDPRTGKELWHCEGIGKPGGYSISSPIAKNGIVYAIGGGGPSGPATALAIRAGGRGDVTKTHIVWRQSAGSSICSPVMAGGHLVWVAGSVTCLSASDGKIAHHLRLYDARGEYVSAVAAGDHVYALTRSNGLFVLEGAGKFADVARLEFDDDSVFNGSPAVSDGRLYVRSNAYLYCIGTK